MKYIERLQANEEEIAQSQAQAQASETEAELDARISSKQAQITRLENQADKTMNQYPLDLNVVSSAKGKVRAAKEELADLKGIKEDLFGSEGERVVEESSE